MDGKVVVVTGGSAGVGRAAVREVARRGADVAVLARGAAGLAGAQRDVERFGRRALAVEVDVADVAAVDEAAGRVEDELGPIDVWVNNAFAGVFAPFLETEPDEFERVTRVTYLGYVHGTMAALRRMRPRNQGVIVQVGSALAYRGIPLQSAYCGAKHAIQGFTESVRAELLHEGSSVHVTIVQLPALNTPQFGWARSRLSRHPQPVPPIYQPEVAARAIAWAAEHRRRELYVGMPTLVTIIGDKLAPGLGDRYLARTGYDAQQTEVPADHDRPDNLFEPVDEDRGAHGIFDERSHASSPHLWLTTHRGAVGLGAAALAVGVLARRR